MPTTKRNKHKRPPFYVYMEYKPQREEGIRTSTKKRVGRRIVATGESETRTYELHSTKGYRSYKKSIEKDDPVVTI